MKYLFAITILCALSICALAQSTPPITVQEVDGTPKKTGITKFIFSNGSVTISGNTATVATGAGGGGDVSGPASSTDNAIVRFDSTTGKLLQNSVVLIGDTGNITGAGTIASAAVTVTSGDAACLGIGPNGNTNPVIRAVCNVASAANGIQVTGNAAGTPPRLAAISSGSNEDLVLDGQGTGIVRIDAASVNPTTAQSTMSFFTVSTGTHGLVSIAGGAALRANGTDLFGVTQSANTVLVRADGGYGSCSTNVITCGTSDTRMARLAAGVYRFSDGTTGTGGIAIGPSTITGAAGMLVIDQTITAGGTTGAQTINKAAGTVNFAAAATSLVVTNSMVTTSSLVFVEKRTNDATCNIQSVVPASGSFTINMTAACAAETSVGFFVLNR